MAKAPTQTETVGDDTQAPPDAGADTLTGGAGADSVAGADTHDEPVAEAAEAAEAEVAPPQPAAGLTEAQAVALVDHVDLRASELASFCRAEADKLGMDAREVGSMIVGKLHSVLFGALD